ncbi:MAG: hypothetical protein KatS3mg043_1280 [Rhodothermaceae bacterium]|nr:MAG: hypothetical protein KatS3mg043_1280 [Rhodothermaceae bacterium]
MLGDPVGHCFSIASDVPYGRIEVNETERSDTEMGRVKRCFS